MKFAIDTNLYIRAFRNPTDEERMDDFYQRCTPSLFICSVVLHELEVGGTSRSVVDWVDETTRPVIRSRRVVTPSHAAWREAGSAINRLALAHRIDRRTIARSLVNDVLIAATCRESGVTLITDNNRDFATIHTVLPFDFVPPWP